MEEKIVIQAGQPFAPVVSFTMMPKPILAPDVQLGPGGNLEPFQPVAQKGFLLAGVLHVGKRIVKKEGFMGLGRLLGERRCLRPKPWFVRTITFRQERFAPEKTFLSHTTL
jgi:hypothetical protein